MPPRSLLMVLALSVLTGVVHPGHAQEPGLDEIERLARSGQASEARAELVTWWDQRYEDEGREEQQRALWLRARLTVDPEQARRDYQRLVVLYPGGSLTDQALLRLAQAAHALGDAEQARTHVDALLRDHPRSSVTRAAEEWLRSAGDPPTPATEADARASTEDGGSAEGSAPEADGPFSVQLGAFSEGDRARGVHADATEAGFDARLVRVEGSPLLHVRVGSFAEREGAQEMFDRLAREGLQGAVVRDERPERSPSG